MYLKLNKAGRACKFLIIYEFCQLNIKQRND